MQIDPLLRALADPTRLRIMRLLSAMELAVRELAQVLGQSQPRVSRHIRILCEAGLVERRKEGAWVFLRNSLQEPEAPLLAKATAQLLDAAEQDDAGFAQVCREDRLQLSAIRSSREAMAEAYFARHAGEWDQLRNLHAPDEPVEAALVSALSAASLGRVLDVGTGTGRIAELLAGKADHVTGLDKSPEMLRMARARLQGFPADRVDLVQGEFTDLPFAPGDFDTVLFHQVLHYAQEPGVVLAEAARVVQPGGRLAVVDFASHDREELRERHAHARLGFSDEQMQALFADAGFDSDVPLTLSGSPLTVKIWTGRRAAAASNPSAASHLPAAGKAPR